MQYTLIVFVFSVMEMQYDIHLTWLWFVYAVVFLCSALLRLLYTSDYFMISFHIFWYFSVLYFAMLFCVLNTECDFFLSLFYSFFCLFVCSPYLLLPFFLIWANVFCFIFFFTFLLTFALIIQANGDPIMSYSQRLQNGIEASLCIWSTISFVRFFICCCCYCAQNTRGVTQSVQSVMAIDRVWRAQIYTITV